MKPSRPELRKCLVRVQLRVLSGASQVELPPSEWLVLREGSLESEEAFRQLVQQLASALELRLPPWLVPSRSGTGLVRG